MSDDDLRKLLADATPGPWGWKPDEDGGVQWCLAPGVLLVEPGITDGTPDGDSIDRANAALISAAPDLAAEVLRLRETEAALRAEVERLRKALTLIVNAGGWYASALEIDSEHDGEELERIARAALGDKEASHE